MKFLHLADLHIGKTVNDFSMIEDQKAILEQILEIVSTHGIDGVLIAGDVYDRSVPSEEAVRLLDYFLCRLSGMGTEVFLISGNHDSEERLNFGSALFLKNKIYIAAKYEGKLCRIECEDAFGKLFVYLLPFVKASQVKHFYPKETIESYEDAVRVVLAHAGVDPSERNILAAHQFVTGMGEDPHLAGSENTAVVGTIEKIGAGCFGDFDYVALGHIHSPQKVGRETIRYAGSPLKYSLSEIGNVKSVPVITLEEKGKVTVELVELKPIRDMRHLRGKMEQLLEKDNIRKPEDYIYVTLTDEDPINDAMAVFRQYYKNIMKIDYDNEHTRSREEVTAAEAVREKTYPEQITDFYQMMYGREISGEELQMMLKAAREAGVMNETSEIES